MPAPGAKKKLKTDCSSGKLCFLFAHVGILKFLGPRVCIVSRVKSSSCKLE